MKLLFENWRHYLKEASNVDPRAETQVARPGVPKYETDEYDAPYRYEGTPEKSRETYFGRSPDSLQCIKDLRNQAVDVYPPDFYNCMEQEGYAKLGAGSFRAVFDVPENPELILKVVAPANSYPEQIRSREMNKKEAKASFQTASDLVPKVYDSARDYFWIISEKVKPIISWEHMENYFPYWNKMTKGGLFKGQPEIDLDFPSLFYELIKQNTDHELIKDAILNALQKAYGTTDITEPMIELSKPIVKNLINNSMFANIRDLLAQFGLPEWDIRPHNVGYTIRNGKAQFVILDPGFELKDLF